jgi:polar amino acid transport system permease protein
MIAMPRRHVSWWAGGTVIVLLVVGFIYFLITNQNMGWPVVGEYFFNPRILQGVLMTLELTAIAMILGVIMGIVLAVMRLSANPVFQGVSWVWIWFFRGVPPLVQLVFFYNLALLIPNLTIGIPFGPELFTLDMNSFINPMTAAILGLSFTESAYAAEQVRAGIQAVDKGQAEASATLGMTKVQSLRRIILPQALRIVIPPLGNDTIGMLKFTSLVSVIALADLLFTAQTIYARNYQIIPLLIVATLWYLVLTTVLTLLEHLVEKKLNPTSGRGGSGKRKRAQSRFWSAPFFSASREKVSQ